MHTPQRALQRGRSGRRVDARACPLIAPRVRIYAHAMSAPALSSTSSLHTLRDDLVFTSSRLLADPLAAALEKVMAGLLKEWSEVHTEQLQHWDAQAKAEALVGAADDNLDDFIPVFANAVRALPGGEKSATWSLFFKVPPYAIAAPVLGDELEAVRRWSQLLGKSKEASLTAHKKQLDKLIASADHATKARNDAALANQHFRTQGKLAAFFERVTKKRDGLAAELTTMATESETLPRNYASRFFRKRTTKVSAEEKAAKAAKKEAERQAKAQAEAAVKAAQAKVKAAMAELKAAKKTK